MNTAPLALLYGVHAVQSLLTRQPEKIRSLLVDHSRHDARIQSLLAMAFAAGIAVQRVAKEEIHRQAGEVAHQGVLAYIVPGQAGGENHLEDLLDGLHVPPFILVLDGVTDPHNLGACLRTADAAGVHAVVVPKDRACGLTAVVRKVACGAAELVPFIQVTNLARSLRGLKERGIWCVGLDADAAASLYEIDLKGPLAMVLGAEGAGLRQLTRELMDHVGQLPMTGTVASLNVSVSTGIALYEAVRQRRIPSSFPPPAP
ncbi:MAG: 23S rRNA (guanosine(2251)-2'-O)-methyltransferase RlmB [Gammaproteobacteria bacterium]|nr:23S rRNA (guanosine(2251)-2'-O)-methyltransferase RlmB [Gammaproteobacteria bacterium]